MSLRVDERELALSIQEQVEKNQRMFLDDLKRPIEKAAGGVIKGNITGKGGKNPRPIGKYGSKRARYFRGWVEGKHGSSRARRAGTTDQDRVDATRRQREYLRNRVIMDAVGKAGGNRLYEKLAARARGSAKAISARKDPKEGFRQTLTLKQDGKKPSDLLSQYLSYSAKGQKLTRRAGRVATKLSAGTMRYGFQTGLLADAWYALDATPSGELKFTLSPSKTTTAGTPVAEVLTRALARQAGEWYGLMDTDQLLMALKDEGVISS